MTPATKAIYRWMLKDYVRVSSMSEAGLFNDKDVEASLTKIEVVDFHQTVSTCIQTSLTCFHDPVFHFKPILRNTHILC
jgi:Cft2 family RNA processing exonuclease